MFADGSSHCFANVRKLGNHRSCERLRCFKSSKATNLAILIILAGDTETNPGPRSKCGLCKKKNKKNKVSGKVIECVDCKKRYHAKCSDLNVAELIMIENGSNDWYCTNCEADCCLCSRAVLNSHKAVQCDGCDGCELWIHNECSSISEDDYENVLTTRCTWIYQKCDFFKFSDSFFDDQLNLMTPNRFSY